jgi:hypothetical protein
LWAQSIQEQGRGFKDNENGGYQRFQFAVAYVILRKLSNQGEVLAFYQRRNFNLWLVKGKLNETKPHPFY